MSACEHDWSTGGRSLDVVFVLDHWQGPTDAIVRCRGCGDHALLRLLHWSGRNLDKRIFAISSLEERPVAVFLRNMKSAYCDLTRHSAEAAALAATAGPVCGAIIVRLPAMEVISTLSRGELGDFRIVSWRQDAPDEKDPFWLSVLSRHDAGVGAG